MCVFSSHTVRSEQVHQHLNNMLDLRQWERRRGSSTAASRRHKAPLPPRSSPLPLQFGPSQEKLKLWLKTGCDPGGRSHGLNITWSRFTAINPLSTSLVWHFKLASVRTSFVLPSSSYRPVWQNVFPCLYWCPVIFHNNKLLMCGSRFTAKPLSQRLSLAARAPTAANSSVRFRNAPLLISLFARPLLLSSHLGPSHLRRRHEERGVEAAGGALASEPNDSD